jgi:hypothetical protein
METRTYRNYTITKFEIGFAGRPLGHQIGYRTTCGQFQHQTLKGVKALIDATLDATTDDIAHRDAIIAMLSK